MDTERASTPKLEATYEVTVSIREKTPLRFLLSLVCMKTSLIKSYDALLDCGLAGKEPQLASKEETQVESSTRLKKKRRTQASMKQVQASTSLGASDEERGKEIG